MTIDPFDTLRAARRLEGSGFTPRQADAIVSVATEFRAILANARALAQMELTRAEAKVAGAMAETKLFRFLSIGLVFVIIAILFFFAASWPHR